ncbi:MAG: alpha/beta fold hydrolase [Dehalococcoidia bacterium]
MLTLAILSLIGWYYAGEIEAAGFRVVHEERALNVEVVEVGEGTITLEAEVGDSPLVDPALWGLDAANGYGHLGEIISADTPLEPGGQTVTRQFELIRGTVSAGDQARLDRYVFNSDPEGAHGIPFDNVVINGPLGELPAWYVDGDEDTWAILVHGRTGTRAETLRMLPPVVDAGLPALIISYRNDEVSPLDPSGYYQYGLTEWEDLEAAARYALDNGAENLVLMGFSMGGSIATQFLYESELAEEVAGVFLDSPMLDMTSTLELGAEQRGVPGFITNIAKVFSTIRSGVDWAALDYLSRADELDAPILLVHGNADAVVPVSTSDRLAEERPDIVEYIRFVGAQHVGSWNMDQERYESELHRFLVNLVR